MSENDTLEYRSIIATEENAKAVQRMRLDSVADIFDSPRELANPNDTRFINKELSKLAIKSDRFVGSYLDGSLVGFMETRKWSYGDEKNYEPAVVYLTEEEAQEAENIEKFKRHELEELAARKLGIVAIGVTRGLNEDTHGKVIRGLLHQVPTIARSQGATGVSAGSSVLHAVNIGLYERDDDQLTRIVRSEGFMFSGAINWSLVRNQGIVQRLYTKPLDIGASAEQNEY